MSADPLLQVRDLRITLGTRHMPLEVVRDVSFAIEDGRTLGLVGESGCGKSITMLALMGLLSPKVRVSGSIRLSGQELIGKSTRELAFRRGQRLRSEACRGGKEGTIRG